MPDKFKHRSETRELLDSAEIPKELLFVNLHELDILNKSLGGHSTSILGIQKLVTDKNKTYHIADLGCGSGDTMKCIADWAKRNGYRVKLTGVDMNANAIAYLKRHCMNYHEIRGVISDYHDFLVTNRDIDIVLCSLFCHHLNNDELSELFRWLNHNVRSGFVMNDLQRNRLAYYGAWLFARIFDGSLLAKNDGPVSVLRGFKLNELKALLRRAKVERYQITRRWAFRYLLVVEKYTH